MLIERSPRRGRRRARRGNRSAQVEVRTQLVAADERLAQAQRLRDDARLDAEDAVACVELEPGLPAVEAAAVEDRYRQAEAAAAGSALAFAQAREEQATAERRRAELSGLAVGGPADIEAASRRLAPVYDELADLRKEHHEVRAELRELDGQTVREAKVVATTLAKLAVDNHGGHRAYDHVVVDEVPAALGPHVAHAATLARAGVTLLGDFLQNGPISAVPEHQKLAPEVGAWLRQDVFAYLGQDEAKRLPETPGVDTLTDQYRFGPVATALANAIAYGELLRVATASGPSPLEDGLGEVVFVDTTQLGDLARSERHPAGGRWWTAGALLAETLAARYAADGYEVGVVTPYRWQHQLIDDLVAESAHANLIEVGTSHRFQGREYPVVVFDLVEDGHRPGWVAKASADGTPWERNGLRLANVGVTRHRTRLFLIGGIEAVRRAKTGPLLEIGNLIRRQAISLVDRCMVPGRSFVGTAVPVLARARRPGVPARRPHRMSVLQRCILLPGDSRPGSTTPARRSCCGRRSSPSPASGRCSPGCNGRRGAGSAWSCSRSRPPRIAATAKPSSARSTLPAPSSYRSSASTRRSWSSTGGRATSGASTRCPTAPPATSSWSPSKGRSSPSGCWTTSGPRGSPRAHGAAPTMVLGYAPRRTSNGESRWVCTACPPPDAPR